MATNLEMKVELHSASKVNKPNPLKPIYRRHVTNGNVYSLL